jgi:hypothetical protein
MTYVLVVFKALKAPPFATILNVTQREQNFSKMWITGDSDLEKFSKPTTAIRYTVLKF